MWTTVRCNYAFRFGNLAPQVGHELPLVLDDCGSTGRTATTKARASQWWMSVATSRVETVGQD